MVEWQPDGKWKLGCPKTTWRKTEDKECRQDGWTSWAEARGTGKQLVTALCTTCLGEN